MPGKPYTMDMVGAMHTAYSGGLLAVMGSLALLACAELHTAETPPQPAPAPANEPELRRKFMKAFTGAEKPESKAESVFMLKGVREKDSLKLLTGLLGDSLPTVRRNACQAMAATPDPEGYFIKPLTAALYDRNFMVRSAAAEALGVARLKAQAVKALSFALTQAAQDGIKLASYAQTLDKALVQLTGKHFAATDDLKEMAVNWSTYYQEQAAALEREDERLLKALEKTAAPESPGEAEQKKEPDAETAPGPEKP